MKGYRPDSADSSTVASVSPWQIFVGAIGLWLLATLIVLVVLLCGVVSGVVWFVATPIAAVAAVFRKGVH